MAREDIAVDPEPTSLTTKQQPGIAAFVLSLLV
jgi:hypothetical protein